MITRSYLIFRAEANIPCRFLLVRAVARTARLLHKRGTRMGQTINEVLELASEERLLAQQPIEEIAISA